MSAPDVIYLQWYGDQPVTYIDDNDNEIPIPENELEEPTDGDYLGGDITWCQERIYDADIVYRRERTCAWTSKGSNMNNIKISVSLVEVIVFDPPEGMEDWRAYRIEYGGHADDCVRQGMIWLPPHVDPRFMEGILRQESTYQVVRAVCENMEVRDSAGARHGVS